MSALLKEPKAVSGMLEQLPNLDQVTAESLQAALIGMLHSLKSEEHNKQMEQLNRQGVARFTGSASTCRIWGIVRPSAKETSTHPTDHQSTVQKHIDQADRQAEPSSDNIDQADRQAERSSENVDQADGQSEHS